MYIPYIASYQMARADTVITILLSRALTYNIAIGIY